MKINLHIERIVLDGLPVASHRRDLVLLALESELTLLLRASGLAPDLMSGGAMQNVRVNPIRLMSRSAPRDLGKQIAAAIHGGIADSGTNVTPSGGEMKA